MLSFILMLPFTGIAQNLITITDSDLEAGETYVWTSDNEYLLDGVVFVEDGAELYIEPGTIVRGGTGQGNNASALVITRGAKIFAEGTASNPVIFTAEEDDGTLGLNDRGLWGGVVVLGYATTNNPDQKQIEGINELTAEGDDRAVYGGDDDNDSSGILRYVSIRHTGIAIGDQAGNEIQGLTLGGVGRGTIVEYVESYASADDGFEWFGGTVDGKYLVSAFTSDDNFDWDEGFRGRGQFWFAIQGGDEAGRIAEMDGSATDAENTTPFGRPIVSNVTYIGAGADQFPFPSGDGNEALIFRDNTGGEYHNSVITDFGSEQGLAITIEDVSGENTFDSRTRLEQGDLALKNNIWFGFSAGDNIEDYIPQDFARTYLTSPENNNQVTDPMLRGIDRTQGSELLDPRPSAGSPAESGAVSLSDNWFSNVPYKGAFSSNTNWMQGWTALDEKGYLTPVSFDNPNLITITDSDLEAGETYVWTSDNEYLLDGVVFVEDGAELYIEPGTIVRGGTGQGNNASALVITRGAKIFAEGTASNPVIFTAEEDDGTLGLNDRGLWGGVVVLGYATTNNPDQKQIEGINELTAEGDDRAVYGGDDDNDSSGILRYVSIRHTGIAIGDQAGNEIQGLTLGGVGRGTIVEYVESYASADDGFEWFGGTVDGKYLVSAFTSDDNFDWDEGFRGRGQFWFAIQGGDEAGRIAEMDGSATDAENTTPFGRPIVSNVTYIGAGADQFPFPSGDGNEALIFRDNTGGEYHNSVITDFGSEQGLAITIEDVSGENTFDSRTRLEQGDLALKNNIWFGFSAGDNVADFIPQEFVRTYLTAPENNNQVTDPMLRGIDRTEGGGMLDPRPDEASPVWNAAQSLSDSWFTNSSYIGAFDGRNWMQGWTALDEKGYLNNDLVTDLEEVGYTGPEAITLNQNYPNPFNPTTQISFTLPSSENVSLEVFDITGRSVATLVSGVQPAGTNTVQFDASNLSSGMYIYRLQSNSLTITRKMMLVK
ncbi:T9SS type A sorting domain-containing protein [Rhodohalobacter sp. 8-1]|uniref:T9SS type A sorting domain-containing protein n=1 Tax=Rhodohalobacter sp. 8-1 TaxID=3131972 RepID=UPI0030EEDCD5